MFNDRVFCPFFDHYEFQLQFDDSQIDLNRNFRFDDHLISEDFSYLFIFFNMTGRPFSNLQK